MSAPPPSPSGSIVTVVTGVPRSGTSLVMQMLAAGGHPILTDDARPPDADNPRGYLEYAPVKRLPRDASWLIRARGRAVKVIHALVPSLPQEVGYRVILVTRNLAEVIASQRVMLARRGAAGDGLGDDRLAAVLRAQLADLRGWVTARGVPLLELSHAEILATPTTAAGRLAGFVDADLDETPMSAVVEPSLYRQRLPTGLQPGARE